MNGERFNRADELGQVARQADEAHGQREEGGARQDQADHAVDAAGGDQALP